MGVKHDGGSRYSDYGSDSLHLRPARVPRAQHRAPEPVVQPPQGDPGRKLLVMDIHHSASSDTLTHRGILRDNATIHAIDLAVREAAGNTLQAAGWIMNFDHATGALDLGSNWEAHHYKHAHVDQHGANKDASHSTHWNHDRHMRTMTQQHANDQGIRLCYEFTAQDHDAMIHFETQVNTLVMDMFRNGPRRLPGVLMEITSENLDGQ